MTWKRSSFEPHPEGVFPAQLVEWSLDEQGQFGSQVRLQYDTDELMEDGRPFRISQWVKPVLHPKSTAYTVLRAFGLDPDTLDPESVEEELNRLIEQGARVNLVVQHKASQDGTIRARVANVLPLNRRSAPQKQAAASRPAPEPAASAASSALWSEEE